MQEKRVLVQEKKKGLGVSDYILIGVLLAAGAVLKFFVGSVINFGGMKPNFIIAMYCLIILIVKPGVKEAGFVGLLAGIICQFFPGTPYINIASEMIGAIAMVFLMKLPLQTGKLNFRPIVCTFISTLISGFSYLGILYLALYAGLNVKPTALAVFLGIIFGTATINAVLVQVLYLPLKAIIKKGE